MEKRTVEVVLRIEYEFGRNFTPEYAEELVAKAVADAVDKAAWLTLPGSRHTPEERKISLGTVELNSYRTIPC